MAAPRSDGGGLRAKTLDADNRVLLVLVLIYDCLFNHSSFNEVTLPMRPPKSSYTNHNKLIISIKSYALLKSDEVRKGHSKSNNRQRLIAGAPLTI